jgi:hypothetical protein
VLGITNREFPGTIKKGSDPKNRGRYLVHIPELMYTIFDTDQDGIFCVNHTHKWRDTGSDPTLIGGSYYPLLVGTRVIIKFFSEDYESGYIDRVISDYTVESLPEESVDDDNPKGDRDNYYQIVRTKEKDIISVKVPDGEKHKLQIHYTKNKGNWVIVELTDDGFYVHSEEKITEIAKNDVLIQSEESSITENAKTSISEIAGTSISEKAGSSVTVNAGTSISETAGISINETAPAITLTGIVTINGILNASSPGSSFGSGNGTLTATANQDITIKAGTVLILEADEYIDFRTPRLLLRSQQLTLTTKKSDV